MKTETEQNIFLLILLALIFGLFFYFAPIAVERSERARCLKIKDYPEHSQREIELCKKYNIH